MPHTDGGLGLTPNVIVQTSAKVDMVSRFLGLVGSLPLDEQYLSDGKMIKLSTICQRQSGSEIIGFSYVNTTIVDEKFIDSYSLRLRQMTSKTYHSVARNKAYKTIPSLL